MEPRLNELLHLLVVDPQKFELALKKLGDVDLRPQVLTITPDVASALLRRNTINRKIRRSHVEFLARQIKSNRWIITHQGLAISTTGMLLDGQHRLEAIALAGQAVQMMVTFNVPATAFKVIDTGQAPRSLADVTGYERKIIEPVTFLQKIAIARMAARVTVDDIAPMFVAFGDLSRALNEYCAVARKGVGNAPTRAAAIFIAKIIGDDTYPFSMYRALILERYEDMTPTVQTYNRRLTATQHEGREMVFTRACLAFDPARSEIVRVSSDYVSSQLEEYRAKIASIRKQYERQVWKLRDQ